MKPLLVATILVFCPTIAGAQEAAGEKDSSRATQYIPGDAIAVAFVSPSKLLQSPEWELMPTEVIQASALQYVGIDPMNITELKLVVGMISPSGPMGGLVVRFNKDLNIEDLSEKILSELDKTEYEGIPVYEVRDSQPTTVRLHQPDERTLIVAVDDFLRSMLAAEDGVSGRLPELAGKMSQHDGLTIIAVMEQIRPLLTGVLRQNASQLPPPLRNLSEIGELTDALYVNLSYGTGSGMASVAALGRDEASAVQLEQTLNNALAFGRGMVLAQMMRDVDVNGEGPVAEATGKYFNRLANHITQIIRPKRQGNVVRINLDGQSGIGSVGQMGVMVGMLLPAVQAAREASRRMNASNNLKQIALAMHNYHSAYKKLPDRAITDDNGTALLSWRVAILPFIEQGDLYQKFHLDEPWDSPHNIQLLESMPEVYVDPSAPLPPGLTIFQVPQGEELMFPESGERRFREILDGLSNTIMAVETSRESAVPWTKPEDIEIDLTRPLVDMGDTHPGGFHVMMADGAVVFIAQTIDPELFKSLLTRAGKEAIMPRR